MSSNIEGLSPSRFERLRVKRRGRGAANEGCSVSSVRVSYHFAKIGSLRVLHSRNRPQDTYWTGLEHELHKIQLNASNMQFAQHTTVSLKLPSSTSMFVAWCHSVHYCIAVEQSKYSILYCNATHRFPVPVVRNEDVEHKNMCRQEGF